MKVIYSIVIGFFLFFPQFSLAGIFPSVHGMAMQSDAAGCVKGACQAETSCMGHCLDGAFSYTNNETFFLLIFFLFVFAALIIAVFWRTVEYSPPILFFYQPRHLFNTIQLLE